MIIWIGCLRCLLPGAIVILGLACAEVANARSNGVKVLAAIRGELPEGTAVK